MTREVHVLHDTLLQQDFVGECWRTEAGMDVARHGTAADLVARFRTGDAAQYVAPARAESRPVESPARRMMGNVARAFGGNRAVATAAAQDNWEEF